MKRIVLIAAALLAADLSGAGASRVWAQIPQYQTGPQTGTGGPSLKRSTRPAVSAYTGLLGSSVGAGGGVGYQYFTRVQPQVSTARQLRNLSGSVNRLQSSTGYAANLSPLQQQLLMQQQAPGLSLGPTGHATGYLSHTRYFGTNLQGGTVLSSGTGGLGGISGSSPGFGSAGVSSGSPTRRY
jgi:hypothetical protein